MQKAMRKGRTHSEAGFTLIELLIVIVILGILAAIVVFAVNGIQDRGTASACKADVETVTVAAEAYDAQRGEYADSMEQLVDAGLLHSVPSDSHYTIDYRADNDSKTPSVSVSSSYCSGATAAGPSSETPSSSSSEPQTAYCTELGSAQNSYSKLLRYFYQTNSNTRGMALAGDLAFLDEADSAALAQQFTTVSDLAPGEQSSDWRAFGSSIEQVRQVVAGSGLTWSQLPAIYGDELPNGMSQEQADQLGGSLQQPLNASLSEGRALYGYARTVCAIGMG